MVQRTVQPGQAPLSPSLGRDRLPGCQVTNTAWSTDGPVEADRTLSSSALSPSLGRDRLQSSWRRQGRGFLSPENETIKTKEALRFEINTLWEKPGQHFV